jgi:hypothetical protein
VKRLHLSAVEDKILYPSSDAEDLPSTASQLIHQERFSCMIRAGDSNDSHGALKVQGSYVSAAKATTTCQS